MTSTQQAQHPMPHNDAEALVAHPFLFRLNVHTRQAPLHGIMHGIKYKLVSAGACAPAT